MWSDFNNSFTFAFKRSIVQLFITERQALILFQYL